LLAAHISTTEAYDVYGDVREVNIPTFEPDLSTSFEDPVPWDVMPTGMSDILTQIYGSADILDYVWNSSTFSDVKSNASQPKSNR
jgi:hypothetical protein